MANLIKDMNKDDRLKKLRAMKAAEALPMPDPMIGYEQGEKPQTRTPPTALEPTTPAKDHEQPQTGGDVQPVRKPAEDAAADTPPVDADKSMPNGDHLSGAVENEKTDHPSSVGKTKPPENDDFMFLKLTCRFSEAHFKRAAAIANSLGVKPDYILLKAVQAVAVKDDDFKTGGEQRQKSPIVRREIKMPREKAEAWLAAQDPLGVFARPGHLLREVANNALDRAVEKLLTTLEAKSRNAN